MLDQLVESKSHAGEDNKKNALLLGTFVAFIAILAFFWVGSLANKFSEFLSSGLGGDDLSLETLVAPPIIEEEPKPEPEKQEKQKDPNVDVRKEIIASMDEPPPKEVPKISTERNTIMARDPNKFTVKGDRDYSAANAPPPDYTGPVNTTGSGSNAGVTGGQGNDDTADAPPPPPVKKVPKQISGGVLNGKATSLPKPPYPPAARAVRAAGAVSVQVLIDESGSVVSASAVSGHPLLRAAAVQAARGARFSPTMLSGQAVKVSGVITYNFVP
jgi:TonB family protein